MEDILGCTILSNEGLQGEIAWTSYEIFYTLGNTDTESIF